MMINEPRLNVGRDTPKNQKQDVKEKLSSFSSLIAPNNEGITTQYVFPNPLNDASKIKVKASIPSPTTERDRMTVQI